MKLEEALSLLLENTAQKYVDNIKNVISNINNNKVNFAINNLNQIAPTQLETVPIQEKELSTSDISSFRVAIQNLRATLDKARDNENINISDEQYNRALESVKVLGNTYNSIEDKPVEIDPSGSHEYTNRKLYRDNPNQ